MSNELVLSRVSFDKKIDCSLDCNHFLFKLSSLAVKSICGAQDANACCQFIQDICWVSSNCQEVSEVLTFLRRKWKVIKKIIWCHIAFFWSSLCHLTTGCIGALETSRHFSKTSHTAFLGGFLHFHSLISSISSLFCSFTRLTCTLSAHPNNYSTIFSFFFPSHLLRWPSYHFHIWGWIWKAHFA